MAAYMQWPTSKTLLKLQRREMTLVRTVLVQTKLPSRRKLQQLRYSLGLAIVNPSDP